MDKIESPKNDKVVFDYREYRVFDRTGNPDILRLRYKLYIRNGRIVDIENMRYTAIRHGSDTWDYFMRKYNQESHDSKTVNI